jgi:DNA polymerase-2
MAVCAFDRQILLQTARICERRGFALLHGIVDSLWIRKPGASHADFHALCQEIEQEVGFPVSFEGRYRWVAFLPSRMYEGVPVLNRYFGVFEDGAVKVRGIELRRRDAIPLVAQCQEALLGELTQAPTLAEVQARLPRALAIVQAYGRRIRQGAVPLADLAIVNRLAKNYDQYTNTTSQAVAIRHLADEGWGLMAGQAVTYVITHFRSPNPEAKALPLQRISARTAYDRTRYLALLARGAATILQPFGLDEPRLRSQLDTAALPRQARLF